MVTSKEHRIFSRSFAQADASNDDDVIRSVSLITAGPAKGHNVEIDKTTLQQLLECAKRFKNGVRANLGHFTGVENAFGFINNLRISGEKLLGDLNLFPEHPSYKLIKRQIKTISDTIGFSVFFDGPDEEKEIDTDGSKVKVSFARCLEFFSSDLVGEPAANPSGVFDRNFIQGPTARGQVDDLIVDNKKKDMAEETKEAPDLKKIITECMSDILEKHTAHMDDISDKVDDLHKKIESIGTNDTPVKSDKGAADLEKEEGKDKDSSPGNPGGSAIDTKEMEDDEEKDKKDMEEGEDEKIKKEPGLSRGRHASNKAFKAEIVNEVMNGMLKTLSAQRISPPASATVGSPASEKALNGKSKYKTYHEACRAIHALGNKTKTEAMRAASDQHPELYRAYCQGQIALANGNPDGGWTKEPLFMTEEKKQRNLQMIASGRLI